MPAALQGSNIVREAWSTDDPAFWGSMGFRSNGSVWYPIGASAILRVVAPIAPFRNDAGGQPTGDWNHCGWAGYALCWTWAGSAHFDFTRIHVDLTLAQTPDSAGIMLVGQSVTFTAGMTQTSFPGNPYPVDMSELGWRWISDSVATDTMACNSRSAVGCTKVLQSSGTMYSSAYVNGEQQQKSVHVTVKIPTLKLTASKTTVIAPGDSDTFSAEGNGLTVIQGWSFTPDSSGSAPSITTGASWGSCMPNALTCTNFVSRSGTVLIIGTVDGVQLTASVHVEAFRCAWETVPAFRDSLVRRDLMRLLQKSNWMLPPGDGIAPGDSVGSKRETGGDVWRQPDGTYYFGEDTQLPFSNECRMKRSTVTTARSPLDVKVFDVHAEPVEYGFITYGCASSPLSGKLYQRGPWDTASGRDSVRKVPNATWGGGSLSDWLGLFNLPENNPHPTVSGIVITASDEVWILPADKLRDAQGNPNLQEWVQNASVFRWTNNSDRSCNW